MSEKEQILQPLNKNFKEPKIRFSSFKNDWFLLRIKDILNVKNGKDQKEVEDPNGIYNIYGTGGVIGKTNSFLYDKESVGIGRKGTIDRPFYFSKPFWTVDTLFWSEIKKGYYPKFIYYLFQTINWHKLNQSTGVPSLTSHVIEMQKVYVPLLDEQIKLTNFLDTLDKKIEILEKKISTLKKYKKGIIKNLLKRSIFTDFLRLSDVCKIDTGKLDANQMVTEGKYKFFTCSREDFYIDSYAFDCEAILISGNGDVGFSKYYKGKFNAYQRTYVLHDFLINAKYIKIIIDENVSKIIKKETNIGAMPYIRKSTFDKVLIPKIKKESIEYFVSIYDSVEYKISLIEKKLNLIRCLRNQLLKDMFI